MLGELYDYTNPTPKQEKLLKKSWLQGKHPKIICSCGKVMKLSQKNQMGGQEQYSYLAKCPACSINWVLDCEAWAEDFENGGTED